MNALPLDLQFTRNKKDVPLEEHEWLVIELAVEEEILQELIRKWEIDTAIRLQEDNHKNIFPVVEKPFQAVQILKKERLKRLQPDKITAE